MAKQPQLIGAWARVILHQPIGLLDYTVPTDDVSILQIGTPVIVPLQNKHVQGYIVEIHTAEEARVVDFKMLDIVRVDTDRPKLLPHVLQLMLFAAEYYNVAAGHMLRAALPAFSKPTAIRFCCTKLGLQTDIGQLPAVQHAIMRDAQAHTKGFGVIGMQRRMPQYNRQQMMHTIRQLQQKNLLDICVPATKRRKKMLVRAIKPSSAMQQAQVPSVHQQQAIDCICKCVNQKLFETFLLHGITGSGKTEVYLQVIQHVLKQGRTALVLVPEIALTPQLEARFYARFGDEIAVFHSGLSQSMRSGEWLRVFNQQAKIGLGARSALFLPMQNLGVIIVDEEHETSFKQDETPRYNARDLAVVYGRMHQAVVICGSATPSLESFANAQQKRYSYLAMPNRVLDRQLPHVDCINLAQSKRVGSGIFTQPMAQSIEATLSKNQQVILFLNRRGFAPYIFCHACGYSYRCKRCDVGLTLHKNKHILLCHYCNDSMQEPTVCISCKQHRIGAFGLGTERIEQEMQALFGAIPMVRLDRDTVGNKDDLEHKLSQFHTGDARVLIGTQMVAKGHDFPGVSLVGVINADASLNFPDFRAAERTFQLITQVAGRAGRGAIPGRVLLQTYAPDHYAIQAACKHDFMSFAKQEMQHRRELGYPPYTRLLLLRFEGRMQNLVEQAAHHMAEQLQQEKSSALTILGPAPAPIPRVKNQFRCQILIKSTSRMALKNAAMLCSQSHHTTHKIKQIIDIDPLNML